MKISMFTFILWILSFTSFELMQGKPYTYLALGDSYTIGEAVSEKGRWPVQLVDRLNADGIAVADPEIIATTGWTTDELQKGISEVELSKKYDVVSLLIGVNNQYRGYPIAQYRKEFEELLIQAITYAGGNPENVFVVSIPDYGVTPFSEEKELDAQKIANELDQYNDIAKELVKKKGASYTDITKASKLAKTDSSLVASDGLHPSTKMYTQWVDALYPSIYNNLLSR